MLFELIVAVSLIALLVGSYTDIKTREVPDWLNYSVIAMGFGMRAVYSLFEMDMMILLEGLVGFIVMFGIGYLMYYTGQWGGGDTKMLGGLGAVVGFWPVWDHLMVQFFVNLLIVAAVYGLLWSIGLALFKFSKFSKSYVRLVKENKRYSRFAVMLGIGLIAVGLFNSYRLLFLGFGLLVVLSFYLWAFMKAVEESAFHKKLKVSELTEGDWVLEEVKVDGKKICGPGESGLTIAQINKLKKSDVKTVMVKEGIPFVPSFLLAFLVTLVWGNLVFLLF